jgi:C4-dicarboxylate-specific signal transduction histidine kinase
MPPVPLASIAANASAARRWLIRKPPDHDEVQAALDRIIVDSHRTSEVFDGLRTLFGRANQGRQQVDVNEIIFGVPHSLRGELDNHRVAIRVELTSELIVMRLSSRYKTRDRELIPSG